MKKRLFLILTAIFTLCSCTQNAPKQEEQPHGDVSATEDATEPAFRELKGEDFSEISVNVSHQEDIDMLNITEYDLNGLDFGEVLSPCLLSENIENTIKNVDIPEFMREQISEKRIEQAKTDGKKGKITKAVKSGDYIYLRVNFDLFCSSVGSGSHRNSFFAYHIPDGTLKEVYSYSDAENVSSVVYEMTFFDGALWLVEYNGGTTISRIDLESGEKTELMTFDRIPEYGYINGELMLTLNSENTTSYYLYDRNTGKFSLVEECTGCNSVFTGKGIIRDEINDGLCTVVGENFRLETGMKAQLMAAGENTVTVGLDGAGVVYTYDLEKMERYALNIGELGTNVEVISAGDDLIVRSSSGLYYMYLMPRYGLCSNMYSTQHIAGLSESADSYCFFTNESIENNGKYIFKAVEKP